MNAVDPVPTIALRVLAHVPEGCPVPSGPPTAVAEREAADRLDDDGIVRRLSVPLLDIITIDRLDHRLRAQGGTVQLGADVEVVGRGGRYARAAVSPHQEVADSLPRIAAAARQIDRGAAAVKTMILGEPHAVVAFPGAPPGAAAIAQTDVVERLFVIKDECGVEKIVGVERPAVELGGATPIEDHAVGVQSLVHGPAHLVQAGSRRRLDGKGPPGAEFIFGEDVEKDPRPVRKAGNLAAVDSIPRVAIVVNAVVEQGGRLEWAIAIPFPVLQRHAGDAIGVVDTGRHDHRTVGQGRHRTVLHGGDHGPQIVAARCVAEEAPDAVLRPRSAEIPGHGHTQPSGESVAREVDGRTGTARPASSRKLSVDDDQAGAAHPASPE